MIIVIQFPAPEVCEKFWAIAECEWLYKYWPQIHFWARCL